MYYDRVYLCEGQKWDLEREVRKRDYEVQETIRKTRNNQQKKENEQSPYSNPRTVFLLDGKKGKGTGEKRRVQCEGKGER